MLKAVAAGTHEDRSSKRRTPPGRLFVELRISVRHSLSIVIQPEISAGEVTDHMPQARVGVLGFTAAFPAPAPEEVRHQLISPRRRLGPPAVRLMVFVLESVLDIDRGNSELPGGEHSRHHHGGVVPARHEQQLRPVRSKIVFPEFRSLSDHLQSLKKGRLHAQFAFHASKSLRPGKSFPHDGQMHLRLDVFPETVVVGSRNPAQVRLAIRFNGYRRDLPCPQPVHEDPDKGAHDLAIHRHGTSRMRQRDNLIVLCVLGPSSVGSTPAGSRHLQQPLENPERPAPSWPRPMNAVPFFRTWLEWRDSRGGTATHASPHTARSQRDGPPPASGAIPSELPCLWASLSSSCDHLLPIARRRINPRVSATRRRSSFSCLSKNAR